MWIPSSARFLYPDDGSKLLLGDLRITSPIPASAELRLYGLPVDQTARDYIWHHRIGGPTTAVFGTRTKINPDVLQVALHPFLMSHQFRDTNGSLELTPTFPSKHPGSLTLASDGVERRATLSLARGSGGDSPRLQVVTSARQSDVVAALKNAVPELKVIPRYLGSQTYASLQMGDQMVEGFFLSGRETGNWIDTVDGVEGAVYENTRQNLAIARYQHLLPRASKLTVGASWEGDHIDSEHRYGEFNERRRAESHILNPRIAFSTARDALTMWASRYCVESEPGGSAWRASTDAGAEGRIAMGWFAAQPSISVQHFRDEATILHGLTATARPGRMTLSAGYGTYADYFVFRDGVFGNVFDPGAAQEPQRAIHYASTIQFEPDRKWPFDLVRVTALRKDLDVDLWGSRSGIRVLSADGMVAKGGTPSWEIACLANDARRSDGPVVGLIPFSVRAGVSHDLARSFNVSLEANFRSGSIAEYRSPGPRYGQRFKLDPSHYVNAALTQRFRILDRPAHLTVTVFNALALAGSRAEIAVDQNGRRFEAPCWANARLQYDLW